MAIIVKQQRSIKRIEHKAYHKMRSDELKLKCFAPEVAFRAASELEARSKYTKKYYRGKYDRRHARFMQHLYSPLKNNTTALLSMSLDTLVDLSRIGAR